MKVIVFLLLAAGIALFVLYRRSEEKSKSLQLTIQNNEKEISGLKNEIISTKKRMTIEFQEQLASKISELEAKHTKELEEVQYKIKEDKDELYQKGEKDLLVDIVLGLGAMSKSQNAIIEKVYCSQEDVKSIKDNLFNIGDSVLPDISAGHAETMAKLGVQGDMSIASILADILDIMSKK